MVSFLFNIERESNPAYDAGIVSDGMVLGFLIFVFIIVIAVRGLAQYIWFNELKGD